MKMTKSLNRIRTFPFRQSLMLVRPFHIVHQLSIVLLVLSLKGLFPSWSIILKAWLMLFLLMPFLFGLNDLMHRVEDLKMGRDRLFASDSISIGTVAVFLGLILLIMMSIALESGVATLFWLILMIFCGLIYGYFKHFRRTKLTYSFRMLSGMTFYLVVASYFGMDDFDILVAFVVGIMDLFSHVAGDIRDYPMDRSADVRTFPVLYGLATTEKVIFGLEISGLILIQVIFNLGYIFWFLVLFVSIIGWLTYNLLKSSDAYSWTHAAFHGQKIMVYVLLAVFHGAFALFIPLFLVGWFFSYWLYLWSDGRLLGSSGTLHYFFSNPLGL